MVREPMMAMTLPLDGGCLCGAVRYRVAAAPTDSGYCHCRMCQKNSGAPTVAWALIPPGGFALTGKAPAVHRSSANGERLFCATCGTYLAFRTVAAPVEVSINTATLDDPAAMPPRRHVWVSSRIAWFDTADDLPRVSEGG